ncbi:MAG: NUDIX hydrolase [Desulfobacteraceae bacterium]|nr:NUDIX hydrolase [Desulfobacteraceae bacterium]
MNWKIKKSKYLIDDKWLKVRADKCRMPDGKIIQPYYVLEYPTWVNVFGITKENEVVLVKQYRHGLGQTIIELPSGTMEKHDESPIDAAKRELLEETGFTSDNFIQTGIVSPNPSNHNNLTYCFLALDLKKIKEPHLDETEDLETILIAYNSMIQFLKKEGWSSRWYNITP